MKADGSEQEQLTFDKLDNWFPHPSPDNQSLVYISYLEDQKGSHPFGKDVKLRIMHLSDKKSVDLTTTFYGGQGTINVHSWSPDGKWIAYVRYYKRS
jgi:TolB protein